jgi:fimbrial chaperone protein
LTRKFIIRLLTVLFFFLPAYALAGSFKVVPIKLFLDARTKTSVLKVTNDGTEKVTVQLDAKEWSQDEVGKDRYEETKDIIFFPKIADIEKGEERIIRVGYRGKKTAATERTYRLFVQELPVAKPGEMVLKLALRFGIPIFIKPLKEASERAIEKVELKEGRVLVTVKNNGNNHFVVSKIKAVGLDGSGGEVFSRDTGGWYVLAGVSKRYAVDIPEQECLKASVINVAVEVERTSMDAHVDVDSAQCQRPEEPEESKEGLKERKEEKDR